MNKILLMAMAGLVLFGASAAVSWLMRNQQQADSGDPEPAAETLTAEPAALPEPLATGPVMTHGDAGIPAETVLRLSESIKQREKSLNQREQEINRDEARLKFLVDDMQREKQEIGAVLEELELLATQSKQMLEQVAQSSPVSMTEQDQPADGGTGPTVAPMSPQESKNLKTVAQWLQGMPPDQAATTIRDMCNAGKIDMVVKLLGFFEQRDAAKVLGAMQDPALFTLLADKFRMLQQESR